MTNCDSVYDERDQLVAFLSRIFPSYIGPVDDPEPGWNYAVYIETPEGQLSWHVPDRELGLYFRDLRMCDDANWDGHTTEEKYRRLSQVGTEWIAMIPRTSRV
jgi:hypothetical protein